MKNLAARTLAATLAASIATAQLPLRAPVQPVTGPVKHAGMYHLGTGTWTRNATVASVIGPDTIYNNTCVTTYFGAMVQNENWAHRSVVPSPTHPTVPTIVPGGTGNDEAPGCATSYLVNGFQLEYCSNSLSTVSYELAFQDNYTLCGGGPMVPPAGSTFVLAGLPGGTTVGGQNCWIIDIDLNAATLSFTLLADGTGTYFAPCTVDQFGVRWTLLSNPPATNTDGPIIAGNLTWLGGTATGALTPCEGTDGTIWDSPVNLADAGTGMCSSDFFRADGPTPAPSGPGCYFFGGNPRANFHLELYSAAGCGPAAPGVTFCEPAISGVIACPCGNAPSGPGRGCENSSVTGGAALVDVGSASLATDTVVFTTSGEKPTATSIVLQGDAEVPAGVMFGDGVRCTGGTLRRLYVKNAVGGSITAPQGLDPTVSARAAALGDTISPGSVRNYLVYYRDPGISGCLLGSGQTFNSSQARRILWYP